MAGWIKMPLGMEVGLDPCDIALDWGSIFPTKRGTAPPLFGPCLLWSNGWNGWMKGPLGTGVDLVPGHIVLDGAPLSLQNGAQ